MKPVVKFILIALAIILFGCVAFLSGFVVGTRWFHANPETDALLTSPVSFNSTNKSTSIEPPSPTLHLPTGYNESH